MGLLDTINETEPKKEYQFASGGISDFMNELKRPKQEQNIDEAERLENIIDDQEPENDEPLDNLKARPSVANATGKLLAMALDSGLSTLIGTFIAKDDPANYKADDEQKDDLEDAISEYVKLKGGDIPPGLALIIVVLSIYLPKGAMAFQLRKANQEIEMLKKQVEQLNKKTDPEKEDNK